MKIQKIEARSILDSRKEPTIEISIESDKDKFVSGAPCGKSTGKFEAKPYIKSLQQDINFLNKLNIKALNKLKIEDFKDLEQMEAFVSKNIGANSLFALEASVLKALAAEQKQQLWQFLSRGKPKKFPYPVGNVMGGGLHGEGVRGKEPDFQEFLFISKTRKFFDRVFINKQAHKISGEVLKAKNTNDEGAWLTDLDNEKILEIMNLAQHEIKKQFGEEVEIGVDVASSSFFTGEHYHYKNKEQRLNKEKQINYLAKLAKEYALSYMEDPLEENDFLGFSELNTKTNCLVVGDDLTVTNLLRLKKAVQNKCIDAIIVKPNQNGSLLRVKEIMDFCQSKNIKTIISHRSGETIDTTIADLAVAWKADFIKAGIHGKEREVKLNRIIQIEKSL